MAIRRQFLLRHPLQDSPLEAATQLHLLEPAAAHLQHLLVLPLPLIQYLVVVAQLAQAVLYLALLPLQHPPLHLVLQQVQLVQQHLVVLLLTLLLHLVVEHLCLEGVLLVSQLPQVSDLLLYIYRLNVTCSFGGGENKGKKILNRMVQKMFTYLLGCCLGLGSLYVVR